MIASIVTRLPPKIASSRSATSVPLGANTSAVIAHAAASTAALPMATRQNSAGPREEGDTAPSLTSNGGDGVGRHRHANRSVLEGVWPRARRQ